MSESKREIYERDIKDFRGLSPNEYLTALRVLDTLSRIEVKYQGYPSDAFRIAYDRVILCCPWKVKNIARTLFR